MGKKGRVNFNADGVNNQYHLPRATSLEDGFTLKYRPPVRSYLPNGSPQTTAVPTSYYPAFAVRIFLLLVYAPPGDSRAFNSPGWH